MYETSRVGPEYTKGVEDFLEFANRNNVLGLTTLSCPCAKCRNKTRYKPLEIKKHLVRYGIDLSYSVQALHGENPYKNSIDHPPVEVSTHGENIQEENIEVGGLGMENLVNASYGMHEQSHVNDDSGQVGVSKEPHVNNEKYK